LIKGQQLHVLSIGYNASAIRNVDSFIEGIPTTSISALVYTD